MRNNIVKTIKLSTKGFYDKYIIDVYEDTTFTVYNQRSDLTIGFDKNRLDDLEKIIKDLKGWGYNRERVKIYKS